MRVTLSQHKVQGVTLCAPFFLQKTRNIGLSGQELMFQQHHGLISLGPGEDFVEMSAARR